MPTKNKYETLFFNALRDLFVGAKIEGESGYINLMKIKAGYFENGVSGKLLGRINEVLRPFPDFREELFDKLYTFFQRYFSESGSIYFRHTAVHQNVYEKVYTDDRDVVLFWKTHMLYYVKTDRIFNSMGVEVDGFKFYFDAGKMTLKKSNEKRETIYTFRKVDGQGQLVFEVTCSEKGRKTKIDDILKDLKKADIKINDETLARAFRVFEKQSEVDYFINKDARSFLREQFDIWLYQYLFAGQNIWTQERLAQLQALKEIAFNIIDFISQFEDELVKVWNKPKFVRNSHYVITLDKLMDSAVIARRAAAKQTEETGKIAAPGIERPARNIFERILAHPHFEQQMQEWHDLGMLGSDFRLGMLTEKDLTGEPAFPKYQYLPLDTKYFPDLELDILALFDDLDAALDGWLVHSENYQALNTLLPKFEKRVQCVHIDPPYNTATSGFLYANTFQSSSWLTMMENRIEKAYMLLGREGSFLTHVDENEFDHLYTIFRTKNFNYLGAAIWDKRNPMMGVNGLGIQHEYIFFASNQIKKFGATKENIIKLLEKAKSIIETFNGVNDKSRLEFKKWVQREEGLSGGEKAYSYLEGDGRVYRLVAMGWPNPNPAPAQFFIPLIHPGTGQPCPVPASGWSRSPEKMKELIDVNEIVFGEDETTIPQRKIYLPLHAKTPLSSVIYNGNRGKNDLESLGFEFSYSHPASLYIQLIDSAFETAQDIALDYFAGSGTTAHAVMNLNRADGGKRKYILVEMGEHFNSVILPRVKKVAFSSSWKEGKASGGQGMSHFVKYFDLEQYEETLKQAHYQDSDLFTNPYEKPWEHYIFLRDEKMLAALDVDVENNLVHVHPERLYPDIDLAETLSQRRGKWIKRITAESVELEDGETLSLTNPDWSIIKSLIWW